MRIPARVVWIAFGIIMVGGLPGLAVSQSERMVTLGDTAMKLKSFEVFGFPSRGGSAVARGNLPEVPAVPTGSSKRLPRSRSGTIPDSLVRPRDLHGTRLFFGPTGRLSSQGEVSTGVYELLLSFISVPITDNLTIAGGTPFVPDAIGRIWYAAPKIGVTPSDRIALSAGVFTVFITDDNRFFGSRRGDLGVGYLVGTFGGTGNALTAGIGVGFMGDDIRGQPLIMIGGELLVGPGVKLISENYLITSRPMRGPASDRGQSRVTVATSGGIRVIRGGWSVDAGLGFLSDYSGTLYPMPIINLVYNFADI